MTVPTTSWDETAPAGSQAISLGDDAIRLLKTQIREVIDVDHDFPSSGQAADVGQHKKVTLQNATTVSAGVADAGILHTEDVSSKAELFYMDEDDNDIQITNAGKINGASVGVTAVPATAGGTGQTTIAQGEILYASAANTISKLGVGTAGQALTTAGAAANPAWAGMTTQGDVDYHNGTTRTRLAPGTAGHFLKTNGAGQNPEWATTGFGAWTAGLSTNTTYEASTDLIVMSTVSFDNVAVGSATLSGLTDSSSPPTTRRTYTENPTTGGGYYGSIIFPVKKGDYWRVNGVNVSNQTVQTLALGT